MKKNVIVIAGATASGKSSAALDVYTSLDGELISCDSMQIYRKMNIGTAKPPPLDRRKRAVGGFFIL